jgi:hypothetical protein
MLALRSTTGGAVAQLGARLDGIEEVVGSNPISSTKFHNDLRVVPRRTKYRERVAEWRGIGMFFLQTLPPADRRAAFHIREIRIRVFSLHIHTFFVDLAAANPQVANAGIFRFAQLAK